MTTHQNRLVQVVFQTSANRCVGNRTLICPRPLKFCENLITTVHSALVLQDDSARIVNPNTGETIMSIPPQLASQSVISCAWSNFSQTLYVLLSNSVVHVWQPLSPADPAQLVAIWTEHRRSRLVTISITTQQIIPQAQQRLWGLSSAVPGDEFLFAGTSDGDVWVMDRHASAAFELCQDLDFANIVLQRIHAIQEHRIPAGLILRPQAVSSQAHSV